VIGLRSDRHSLRIGATVRRATNADRDVTRLAEKAGLKQHPRALVAELKLHSHAATTPFDANSSGCGVDGAIERTRGIGVGSHVKERSTVDDDATRRRVVCFRARRAEKCHGGYDENTKTREGTAMFEEHRGLMTDRRSSRKGGLVVRPFFVADAAGDRSDHSGMANPPDIRDAVHKYVAAWNERDDPARRRRLLEEALSDDFRIVTGRELRGRAALEAEIVDYQARMPNTRARVSTNIDVRGRVCRFAGVVEDAEGRVLAEAFDVAECGPDGRLQLIFTFVGATIP
jgi:hypothetical protein